MSLINNLTKMVPANMKVGFAMLDTKDESVFYLNEEDTFPLASIAKFIASVMALKSNPSINNNYVHEAISKHNSVAFGELLYIRSVEGINEDLKSLNLDIKINQDNRNRDHNYGSPAAILKFLQLLISRKLLQKKEMRIVMEALENQEDPDGFRFHEISSGTWYHMTGGFEGICNDVGIFQTIDRTLICVGFITTDDKNIEWNLLEGTLSNIGKEIMNYYGSSK